MISKGSRFGVGSLIVARLRRPQGGKWSSTPLFIYIERGVASKLTKAPHWKIYNGANLQSTTLHSEFDAVLAFRQGQERGFNHFFRKYYTSLCFFARKMLKEDNLAEDIASNAFIKIWDRHSQFQSEEHIKSYLYLIVRNDCLKQANKQARLFELKQYLAHQPSVDSSHFDDIVHAETMRLLYETADQLPGQCKQLFKLYFVEGKGIQEIAEELQLSPSTVKTQKYRAVESLRKKIIL